MPIDNSMKAESFLRDLFIILRFFVQKNADIRMVENKILSVLILRQNKFERPVGGGNIIIINIHPIEKTALGIMHIIFPYILRSGIQTASASPGTAAGDDHDSFYRGLLILTLILFRFFPFWETIFFRDIRIENAAADIGKKVAQIPILIRIEASGKIRPDRLQALSVIFNIGSYVLKHFDRPLAFDVLLEKQSLYGQNPIPMYNIPSVAPIANEDVGFLRCGSDPICSGHGTPVMVGMRSRIPEKWKDFHFWGIITQMSFTGKY